MNVSCVEPVRCTRLHQTKGHAIHTHKDVMPQVEVDEVVERLEAIDLFTATFAVEKPLSGGVSYFDIGDVIGCFHADDVVARRCLRISDEK